MKPVRRNPLTLLYTTSVATRSKSSLAISNTDLIHKVEGKRTDITKNQLYLIILVTKKSEIIQTSAQ